MKINQANLFAYKKALYFLIDARYITIDILSQALYALTDHPIEFPSQNMITPGQACLVLLGTVAKHTTEVMEPHQFFKASVVGDTNDCKEISVDGFNHVAVKKVLTSSELSHNIK